ncbi:MerR family transcriptional regulator [Kribbella deserti]|uniref:MerR family transcriptional regulator n=1 Tax=Kribbella deserti TaxID=1926257 RepID=A0ABV6QP91_9ACTN
MTEALRSRGEPAPVVWPVGRVAAMLGIPAVTLRSWEVRYGIAPTLRSPGNHRRYSDEDVARLRRMQRLIAGGTPPAEAARLSVESPPPTQSQQASAAERVESLLAATEAFRVEDLANDLNQCLRELGVQTGWDEVLAPALRRLGERFLRDGDCTDLETLLADETARAVDRYTGHRGSTGGDRPILLACSPGERHWLPMKVLQAALLERRLPAVLLASGIPAEAVVRAVARSRPRAVVLWSLTSCANQASLRRRLTAHAPQVLAAGPGWSSRVRPLSALTEAVDELSRA